MTNKTKHSPEHLYHLKMRRYKRMIDKVFAADAMTEEKRNYFFSEMWDKVDEKYPELETIFKTLKVKQAALEVLKEIEGLK